MKNTVSNPLILLKTDLGEIPFTELDELEKWNTKEGEAFGWLQDLHQVKALNQVRAHMQDSQTRIAEFIRKYRQEKDEKRKQNLIQHLQSVFEKKVQNGNMVTSGSPLAKFIFQVKNSHSDQVAAFALAQLIDFDFDIKPHGAKLGSFLALNYNVNGSTTTINVSQKASKDFLNHWSSKFNTQLGKVEKQSHTYFNEINSAQNRISELETLITELKAKQEGDFTTFMKNTGEALETFKKTYNEELAIRAPVDYWMSKGDTHKNRMITFGIISLLLALGTCAGVIYTANFFLKTPISEIELARIAIVLAVSTLGIWLTKLASKIFISNLHLETDAKERVTMTKTYLALVNQPSQPESANLKLVLQSLFRPSSSGYIKDPGPSDLQELLSQLLSKK